MFKKLKFKKDFSKMKGYYEKSDYLKSIECADLILDYDENNLEVLKYKYDSLTNLELYDDALECVDKIIDLEPSATAFINKGTSLCFLGELDKGFEILDYVIENCPEYEIAFLNKGNFLYNDESYDELLDLSDWVLSSYPDCSNAYDVKAAAYIAKGDFDSALNCVEDALCCDSKNEVSIERKEFILNKLKNK